MITGAIFDMDGVVLDSMGYWRTVGERYIKSLGIVPSPTLNDDLVLMSMEEGADFMKATFNLSITHDEIMDGIRNMIRDFYLYDLQLKEGVLIALKFLKEKGIPIAVATSSPKEYVTAALKRLGVLEYFGPMFTVAEIGESKHSDKIYMAAAKSIGSPIGTTLAFEDAPYALETVKKAGFVAVGVKDIEGQPDQREVKKADFYLESLEELPNLWSKMNG